MQNSRSKHPFLVYGYNLLGDSARHWIYGAFVAAAMMALVDAVAWGNFGHMCSTGPMAWVVAGLMFIAAFLWVFSLDASLITLDLENHNHSRLIHTSESRLVPPSRWKLVAMLGGRLAIMALTSWVTAPFLTQPGTDRDN